MTPALLLLPNLIAEHRDHTPFLPSSVDQAVITLHGIICESAMAGRRYLSRFKTAKPPHQIPLALFNRHTPDDEIDFLLSPIRQQGERWGYVSDAGLPCLADPGAKLVRRAQQLGIVVQAFVGPSAITLGLMLSGLPGQSFTFHGYLPKQELQRKRRILQCQRYCSAEEATQLFIEAPHRNEATLSSLIELLQEDTLLCVAWDLTLPTQGVMTHPIHVWRKIERPRLHKRCALFLFNSRSA